MEFKTCIEIIVAKNHEVKANKNVVFSGQDYYNFVMNQIMK